jgi:hypothetical protein
MPRPADNALREAWRLLTAPYSSHFNTSRCQFGTRPGSPPFEERLQLAFVEPADR